MKYFRHAPLTLWTLVCVLMGALIVTGFMLGQDEPLPAGVPDRRVATQDVYSLSARMADLGRISTTASLPEWSEETSRLADEAAQRRLDQGASTGDGLVQVLVTMSEDAKNLSQVDVTDTVAVRAGVALLQADSDALVNVLGGANVEAVLPMPGEDAPVIAPPIEGSAPIGGAIPDVPALPELPEGPGDTIPGVPAIPVKPIGPGDPQLPVLPSIGSNGSDKPIIEEGETR